MFETGYDGQFYVSVGDYIVQQFTGMKDKHGLGIYEGDILVSSSISGPNAMAYVAYFKSGFLLRTDEAIVGYFSEPEFECEVIGNICENPGLLAHTSGKDN